MFVFRYDECNSFQATPWIRGKANEINIFSFSFLLEINFVSLALGARKLPERYVCMFKMLSNFMHALVLDKYLKFGVKSAVPPATC